MGAPAQILPPFDEASTLRKVQLAPSKGLATDANMQFKLATKDPKGEATKGIARVQTTRDSFGTGDSVKTNAGGGVPPWPTDRYLNNDAAMFMFTTEGQAARMNATLAGPRKMRARARSLR